MTNNSIFNLQRIVAESKSDSYATVVKQKNNPKSNFFQNLMRLTLK